LLFNFLAGDVECVAEVGQGDNFAAQKPTKLAHFPLEMPHGGGNPFAVQGQFDIFGFGEPDNPSQCSSTRRDRSAYSTKPKSRIGRAQGRPEARGTAGCGVGQKQAGSGDQFATSKTSWAM
jgi:hypothetical protein